MLSFVYTLLTNTITSALETVGLDPCIGYLHTERPGRASLSLDLIEELRAVLADRFVLSLINKKIISGKNFVKKKMARSLWMMSYVETVLTEGRIKRMNFNASILERKG